MTETATQFAQPSTQRTLRDRSQDVQLDPLTLAHGTLFVVRDDLLTGGTKQRAAIPFLLDLMAKGYTNFIYSSPFCGFA